MTAAYGFIPVPPGADIDDLVNGLAANIPRLRAERIIELAQAARIAEEPATGRGVMKAAGVSERELRNFDVASWRQSQRQVFLGGPDHGG